MQQIELTYLGNNKDVIKKRIMSLSDFVIFFNNDLADLSEFMIKICEKPQKIESELIVDYNMLNYDLPFKNKHFDFKVTIDINFPKNCAEHFNSNRFYAPTSDDVNKLFFIWLKECCSRESCSATLSKDNTTYKEMKAFHKYYNLALNGQFYYYTDNGLEAIDYHIVEKFPRKMYYEMPIGTGYIEDFYIKNLKPKNYTQ